MAISNPHRWKRIRRRFARLGSFVLTILAIWGLLEIEESASAASQQPKSAIVSVVTAE